MEHKKKTGRELKSIFAERLDEARKRVNCKSPNAFKNALVDQEADIESTATSDAVEPAAIPGKTKMSERLKRQLEEDEIEKGKTYGPSFDKNTVPYWFNPEKHHVPNMLQLQRIHELCGCDIDYLLGNIDTFKKENNDICAETGLSEDCVDELRSIQKHSKHMQKIFLEQTSGSDKSERDQKLVTNNSSTLQLELLSFIVTHSNEDGITILDVIADKLSHHFDEMIVFYSLPAEMQELCKSVYEAALEVADAIYKIPNKMEYRHEYVRILKERGYCREENGNVPKQLSSMAKRYSLPEDDIQTIMEDAFFFIDEMDNKADAEARNYLLSKDLFDLVNQFVEYKKQSLFAQE